MSRAPWRHRETYRTRIEQLFDRHTRDSPVVIGTIDFSHFLESTEQAYPDPKHNRNREQSIDSIARWAEYVNSEPRDVGTTPEPGR